jgi:hypothetical protein
VWGTDTYWFDVSVAALGLLLGHMLFGHFEAHKPLWRRLLKAAVGVILITGTTVFFGRTAMWILLGFIVATVAVIHGWWLPRNGVNGWTGEPRARYYELIGVNPARGHESADQQRR